MSEFVHKREADFNSEIDNEAQNNIEIGDFDNENAKNLIESADIDKPKAIRVAYEDRWDWWKWVKRQPKSILSDGTKVTLSVLFDCFREEKGGLAWPSKEYLAIESGGVTERAIYGRIEQAENAQALIVANRGGGIVRHDNGTSDGVTCHYYMGIPGSLLQGMRPVPLPVATEDQRAALCAAWDMDWPVDGKMFKRTSMSHADAKYLCVNDALDVLGYLSDSGATLKMTKHVDSVLGPYRSELARQRCLGELSWATVANVLAVIGLKPPDAPQDQIPAYVAVDIDQLLEEGKWL